MPDKGGRRTTTEMHEQGEHKNYPRDKCPLCKFEKPARMVALSNPTYQLGEKNGYKNCTCDPYQVTHRHFCEALVSGEPIDNRKMRHASLCGNCGDLPHLVTSEDDGSLFKARCSGCDNETNWGETNWVARVDWDNMQGRLPTWPHPYPVHATFVWLHGLCPTLNAI